MLGSEAPTGVVPILEDRRDQIVVSVRVRLVERLSSLLQAIVQVVGTSVRSCMRPIRVFDIRRAGLTELEP
jgi:hypothetical protein